MSRLAVTGLQASSIESGRLLCKDMQLLDLDRQYGQLFQQLQGGRFGAAMPLQLMIQPIKLKVGSIGKHGLQNSQSSSTSHGISVHRCATAARSVSL
jgi:hypothetical protein